MKTTPAPPPSECLDWLFASCQLQDPCFVIDEPRLKHNTEILDYVQKESGAKILLALKAFAAWPVFPLLSRALHGPLWGTCASSVDEARLGREKFGGEVHAFAAAFSEQEIRELLQIADDIVFNSLTQWEKYRPLCLQANNSCRSKNPVKFGLRLNPEASQGAVEMYDPCSPRSRLGVRKKSGLTLQNTSGFDGLHFHALCEQGAEDLQSVLRAVKENFGPLLVNRKWLNFGGGHHITAEGYNLELLISLIRQWSKEFKCQIYLEPGEAAALNAGWLSARALDIVEADIPVAILNVSAACHMPDVLEMPYTPPLWYKNPQGRIERAHPAKAGESGKNKVKVRLAGKSCLAGDVIGEYWLPAVPKPDTTLVFGDMAIYSMVKTTTFNGLRLPDIGIYSENGFKLQRKSAYEDFLGRLG